LSLDEFAKLFDTYRATIWRYEQGKRKPQIDFMIAVAQYFGVSIDWLAGISDVKKLQLNQSRLKYHPHLLAYNAPNTHVKA
jgi:transcriptional regulator with XRE-family HTH domain